MKLQALKRIQHNGTLYKANEILEVENSEMAQRLIDLGVAFFVENFNETKEEDSKREEIENEIKDHFTLDELKEDALELGMKFPPNVTKKALIEQIFKEGKEYEFLNLLEDEEE